MIVNRFAGVPVAVIENAAARVETDDPREHALVVARLDDLADVARTRRLDPLRSGVGPLSGLEVEPVRGEAPNDHERGARDRDGRAGRILRERPGLVADAAARLGAAPGLVVERDAVAAAPCW